MFFKCNASLEEKNWQEEWRIAESQANIRWHTLPWQEESRRFHKIFETQIEEIFERIAVNREFTKLFDDEDFTLTIFQILDQYKNALLDELWSSHSYSNVKHVMLAARALEKVSGLAGFQQDTMQFARFSEQRADFKNKMTYSGLSPTARMVGGVLFSYYVGVAALFTILTCCALCPPFLGLVATAACIVPFLLGSKLSISSFSPSIAAKNSGEIVGMKLDSVRL
jgi:hypothetical protein